MNTETLKLKKPGRKTVDPDMMDKILALKTGEELVVSKESWKLRTPPGQYVLRRRTGRNYSVSTIADDSGWVIVAL